MACGQNWDHCVALHIYLVDQAEHEAVENLSTATRDASRSLHPVLQVRATREETLGSILHRAHILTHKPTAFPLASSYDIQSITYNGFALDPRAMMNVPIGSILNDPRTRLLVLNGTLTIANCCCFNYCVISCCARGPPKYDGPRYVSVPEHVMKR